MVKTSKGLQQIGVKKGAWSEEEDAKLRAYIQRYGHWNWGLLPKFAGLSRTGKSCRLRWVNYLRPDIKHGNFTKEEDDKIVHLHHKLGNKWCAIAAKLPGRSDNEIKNRWNTHLKKRVHDSNPTLERDQHGTPMKPADQVNQKENIQLEQQRDGEMNPPELSSCWFNGSDCCDSSNVTSQTSNPQLTGDFWTELLLDDITSSVDDFNSQSSFNDPIVNDEFSWSMLDSYAKYNSEFIDCHDSIEDCMLG